ncbi:uncharacterized protein SPAPADRAFT_49919 [Spathaspora passalidarum NRRL Y-27907]|uniref:Uncharacterized protein n=1 Tax=Spathaspora passalidarum (strain NRRL Y-27907 / 11-Y1) TaxID=619300 RepID=G3AKT5_SPAPN|nr:uncharacterized protein SPAPADRAFT_49919 [Spathaspora passalidarum NRRL Y-27907]EGW32989.1 hypothetical protein SPAPADRAFT_49919 [Spathaspora passalidarum NRRL Y-27907]
MSLSDPLLQEIEEEFMSPHSSLRRTFALASPVGSFTKESSAGGGTIKSTLERLEVQTICSSQPDSLDSNDPGNSPELTRTTQHSEPQTSLDTFSLLYSDHEEPLPAKYPNTSHINTSPSPKAASMTKKSSESVKSIVNPVPHRFSQFVLDQKKNPLDGISIDSPSLKSDYEYRQGTIKSKPSIQRESIESRLETPPRIIRDISDSMGSQATIFSMRHQDIDNLVPFIQQPEKLLTSSIRQRRRQWFKRNKTQRTSNVRLYTVNSSSSSLHRQNAIKFKEGSWAYRVKLRLKKFLVKLKFFSFTVSSKRTKSFKKIKRTNSTSFKSLIGNPSTNPQLGKTPVFKVAKIDRTTLPITENHLPEVRRSRLSEYINQQENTYLSNLPAKAESIRGSEPTVKYADPQMKSLDPWKAPTAIEEIEAEAEAEAEPPAPAPISVSSSVSATAPPAPPPHTDNSFVETHTIPELWKSYLLQVLANRVKLRQEITMFQKFLVDKDLSKTLNDYFDTESKFSDMRSEMKPSKSSVYVDDASTIQSVATTSNYSSLESESQSEEEFNNKVLNRRSMLGDMLEYSSEEEEDDVDDDNDGDNEPESSPLDTTSRSMSSTSMPTRTLSKTYGTIVRRKPTITRSFGISHSLSDLTDSNEKVYSL